MIGALYTRRCRGAEHTHPAVGEELIYLDQMVISHMTKVPTPRRRPGARSIHSGANSSVGHGLQDAARDLPGYGDSPWSLRWTHPSAAVHVRALSQGVSFHDAATVREEQLMEFENWLADHPTGQVRADRDTLVRARSTPGRELLCHGRRSRPEDWPERLTKADRKGPVRVRQGLPKDLLDARFFFGC